MEQYEIINEKLDTMKRKVAELEHELSDAQEGSLFVKKSGTHVKFYHYIGGRQIYINKEHEKLIGTLARKKFCRYVLESAQAEVAALKEYSGTYGMYEQSVREFQKKYPEIVARLDMKEFAEDFAAVADVKGNDGRPAHEKANSPASGKSKKPAPEKSKTPAPKGTKKIENTK